MRRKGGDIDRAPTRTSARRRVCFVTGTRAEFGLMEKTLHAIAQHPQLDLQIVVTGMHLDAARGSSVDLIKATGWRIARQIPWPAPKHASPAHTAIATGAAIAQLTGTFEKLRSDIVLVVGDRVEAFAAASAAHISGRAVAHVHGGDRALGQVDDALRHAITKLAHVHFPATQSSARRIIRLGEERWRVHRVGSPGIDGIRGDVAPAEPKDPRAARFALIVLHPADADPATEHRRAAMVLRATLREGIERVVIVYPNNDPGSAGIIRAWQQARRDRRIVLHRNLSRAEYLGLLRDAAVLVGNSSSGVIEAASFGVPVVDIGPRQLGRERGRNVRNVTYELPAIRAAVRAAIRPKRSGAQSGTLSRNIYEGRDTAGRIAGTLASLTIDSRLLRKLISY